MSISDEISRLSGNISDSFGAVEDMGGTVPQNTNSDNLAAAIRSIPQPDTVTPESIAIVANGNTHAAIASGSYAYVRNHSSLAEGLYQATAAIAENATLSSSNLSAVSSGGLNALFSAITALQSAIGFVANGNKTTASVGVDQFVMLKNSTISGCADGLYLAAKTIPANTAIDSTYLTAVTIGGLNTATNRLRMKKTLSVTSDENSTIDLDLTDEYTVTSVRAYNNQNIVCMPYMMSNGAWRARIIHANTGQPLSSGVRSFIVTYMRA